MLSTVEIPPVNIVTSATVETPVPGSAAYHTSAASEATIIWIHGPAAVTQSRDARSGKLHASFTLQ